MIVLSLPSCCAFWFLMKMANHCSNDIISFQVYWLPSIEKKNRERISSDSTPFKVSYSSQKGGSHVHFKDLLHHDDEKVDNNDNIDERMKKNVFMEYWLWPGTVLNISYAIYIF